MLENLEGEIWKDIVGYEGLYKISNFCRVMSLGRNYIKDNGKKVKHHQRILNPTLDSKGYYRFSLSRLGIAKTVRLHFVFAKAFIPNPNNYPMVRHLNDNKVDNRLENLAWGTDKDNKSDLMRNGRSLKGERSPMWGKFGEKCANSKLILDTQTGIFYFGTMEASIAKNMVNSTFRAKLNGTRKSNNTGLIYV